MTTIRYRCLYCGKTFESFKVCPDCHRRMTKETVKNANKVLLQEETSKEVCTRKQPAVQPAVSATTNEHTQRALKAFQKRR